MRRLIFFFKERVTLDEFVSSTTRTMDKEKSCPQGEGEKSNFLSSSRPRTRDARTVYLGIVWADPKQVDK